MANKLAKLKLGLRPLPDGLKLSNFKVMMALWFGSGLIRPASGTWGTIAALPFGILMMYIGGIPLMIAGVLISLFAGVYFANYYQNNGGDHDAKEIVIDEVSGMWLAAIPAGMDMFLWFVAFVLFRLFDIVKPWPASYFNDKVGGGWGVMMDDIIAGIFAFVGVATLAYFDVMAM